MIGNICLHTLEITDSYLLSWPMKGEWLKHQKHQFCTFEEVFLIWQQWKCGCTEKWGDNLKQHNVNMNGWFSGSGRTRAMVTRTKYLKFFTKGWCWIKQFYGYKYWYCCEQISDGDYRTLKWDVVDKEMS